MQSRRIIIALWVAALVAVPQGLALAGPDGGALARARADWNDQEYERVIQRVDQLLAASAMSRAVRIEALRLKASAFAVLGKPDRAAAAFEKLLGLDPQYRLPRSTSPRIRSVFEPTRARWLLARETALRERLGADLAAMRLGVRLPPQGKGGRPLPVDVRLVDPKRHGTELLLFYRREGRPSYSRLSKSARAPTTQIRVPAAVTASKRPYKLELYVELLHKSGIALRREGSAKHPLSLAMSAGAVPKPTPIYKRWWFWAGSVALGVAAGLLIDQAIDVGPQKVTGMR